MAKLELVTKGVKRVQAENLQPRSRRPITIDLRRMLHSSWSSPPRTRDKVMMWAAASLCFFGFLRSGEIIVPSEAAFDERTHLSFRDVSVDRLDNPSIMKVRLKVFKTDPFRVGVNVCVGQSGCSLYLVGEMLDYLVVRGAGPGPLFRFADGKPLTRARLVEQVRGALSRAGVDSSQYSGHSFRSGAATTAAHHKDIGQVEEQCLPPIYQNAERTVAAVTKKLDKRA